MLWTSCERCWMGKLLFSCSVPSLSATLRPPHRHAKENQRIGLDKPTKKPMVARRGLADLYSSSLLTQALTSSEGSLASRLIHERAEMLQMELPSLTTRRLALVSFPAGGGVKGRGC